MSSTKWHPNLLPRKRLQELARLMYGPNASNDEMAVAIQFLIGVCNEQNTLSIENGIKRAIYRQMNAGDPDLADLMTPAGKPCKAAEMVGNELERGRFTLKDKLSQEWLAAMKDDGGLEGGE